MKISYSSVVGNQKNTSYPYVKNIGSKEDLTQVAQYDHVCAIYSDGLNSRSNVIKGYRSNKTFKYSDCIPMDCDNALSNPLLPDLTEEEWKTPKDVAKAFEGVEFYVVYSRNHMKEKDKKPARPKFHVYFPLSREITSIDEYTELKKTIQAVFPAFDENALDGSRFLFGVENPQVEYFEGDEKIDLYINRKNTEIPSGSRNSTMSHYAGIVLKRFGDEDGKAFESFLQRAENCVPPLDDEELTSIWNSALGFYAEIKKEKGYVSPAEYNSMDFASSLIPKDFTDLGEALCIVENEPNRIAYAKGLGLLYYDGKKWIDDEICVQREVQLFTDKQLAYSWKLNNVDEKAEAYHNFVLSRRKAANIRATMTSLKAITNVSTSVLDSDGFILNTPNGTVDLRTGEMRPHNPLDYCTKMTSVSPSDKGMEEWLAFLDRFTQGDKELEQYLQLESGMEIIGGVFNENAVIQTGPGGNGKSTYNNVKADILGDYAGMISSDLFITGCKRNKDPEFAELRGKRFVLAAELSEGARLDTAALKNLCSTDSIEAAKKFEAPIVFKPTHTTVLFTNHLPKVSTTDKGTWDRIVVVPLTANFRGQKDEIKNYARVLYENCGEAILKWMIEGAKKYIELNFKIEMPDCVKQAIAEYRQDNDWVSAFISECCEVHTTFNVRSGELYECYRNHCDKNGEYKRSSSDFKKALIALGYNCRKTRVGVIWSGLRLNGDFTDLF